MSEQEAGAPRRWLDEDDAAGASRRELLREGSELRPWPPARREQVMQELQQRSTGRARSFAAVAAALALVGAAAVVLFAVRARSPQLLPIGDLGAVALAEHARVTHVPTDDDPVLRLESGSIEAQINHRPAGKPFIVETPQVRVVVVGTRFSVRVLGSLTTVAVHEGRVRVESRGQAVMVSAGESVRSDDARFQPAPPPAPSPSAPVRDAPRLDPSAVSVPECASAAGAEREGCVHRVAEGTGLAAENALVSQALARRDAGDAAGAIASLQTYQSRFPNGLFAPEVAFELVGELAAAGRDEDAVRAGAAAERAFPEDPRTPQVALLCARLLQERLHQPAAAAQLAQRYAGSSDVRVREEALYRLGLAQEAEANPQAAATWRTYLKSFPSGAHADDVRARVKP